MEITDVQMRKREKEGSKMRAIATVILDNEFAVHDIRVLDGKNGLFLAMPSKKKPDGEFHDVANPISSECRKKFEDAIFAKYETLEDEATDEPETSEE